MLKYLQWPRRFDAQRMQKEVAQLESGLWNPHYNKKHYEGDWTVLALRSADGTSGNIYSLHASAVAGGRNYEDTELLALCPYISEVLNSFECEKTIVRLMKLNAGAVIREHRDHDMNFEAGEVRFHIPVHTNDRVEFFIQEERVVMDEGTCWYLNLNLKHRVTNGGTTDRIHLVVDCMVNDWLKEAFAAAGGCRKEIDDAKHLVLSRDEARRVVKELRRLNTEASIGMALKIESEHAL